MDFWDQPNFLLPKSRSQKKETKTKGSIAKKEGNVRKKKKKERKGR